MPLDILQIDLGEKQVAVNGDPDKVIKFNPTDIMFAEKFYALMDELDAKQADFLKRGTEAESVSSVNNFGVPTNVNDRIALQIEVCSYMRERIDYLFGEGTSQKAFGDVMKTDVIRQFFQGITPYFNKAREEKIAQYTTIESIKKNKRKRK